jgi:Putative MetA-pathway of phenol degradation
MKNTIKFAALGACALAASSTAALASSELPAGVTTGIALGAPLPEGVYDISIGSYGSNSAGYSATNMAYAIPIWLIWSTPWTIAGGRIQLDTATGVADVWSTAYGGAPTYPFGTDSWLNTLLEAGIKWNLGNGWNFGLQAGAWLPSDQNLPLALGRNYTAFQGLASVSYLKNGWNLTATGIYGSAGANDHFNSDYGAIDNWQGSWFNLDLTATRKFGKLELGTIAYGSWDIEYNNCDSVTCPRERAFAIGGLVGYDFGSFVAQAKLSAEVMHQWEDVDVAKEVRGTLTIIKPLWSPAADAPLK